MHPTRLIPVAISAALLAGCGSSADPGSTMTSGDAMKKDGENTAMMAKEGTTVRVVSSKFGTILADRRGQAFYRFGKEKTRRSECYGACAKSWPPVLTKDRPAAGKGARASLLGTTRRRDGRLQVTYKGRPLYYYVSDAPGKVLCQNVTEFGGRWQVLRANGTTVG